MLKILIVDDETPVQEWLNYCLKPYEDRFKVVGVANNGREGLRMLSQVKPDVVITDISMPEMDGLSFMEQASPKKTGMKFVVLTNHAEFTYAKQALSCGATEYILKTEMQSKELIHILEGFLEEYGAESVNCVETDNPIINKALAYMHQKYNENISLQQTAQYVFLSPEYFSRLFKEKIGQNFSLYLMHYRLQKARELLQTGRYSVAAAAKETGYQNTSYFSKIYKEHLGVTPESEKIKNNKMSK